MGLRGKIEHAIKTKSIKKILVESKELISESFKKKVKINYSSIILDRFLVKIFIVK